MQRLKFSTVNNIQYTLKQTTVALQEKQTNLPSVGRYNNNSTAARAHNSCCICVFAVFFYLLVSKQMLLFFWSRKEVRGNNTCTSSAMSFCRNFAHFSTSFLGPRSCTMSLFCCWSGKMIMTYRNETKGICMKSSIKLVAEYGCLCFTK